MRPRALLAAAALLLAPALAAAPARAQATVPSLDLRGFHPSTDPASGIYLEPADAPGTGEWNAGLWFSYAFRPVTLRDAQTHSIVFDVQKHQLTGDFTANVGIAHRLALGVDLPVLLYQTGSDPTDASKRLLGDGVLPAQALGDLGLVGKVTLIRPTAGDFGGFALGIHERFTVPTGDEASYLGEGSVTSETRLLAEYRLVAIALHLTAGFKLRGSTERFACGPLPSTAAGTGDLSGNDTCKSRIGQELPFGLGVAFKPQILGIDDKARWTWFLETHGHLPLAPIGPFQSTPASSLAVGLGARYTLRDLSFFAGVETAPLGGVGDAPLRATLGVGWAPRNHDRDGDGIEDDKDQCPELAEDKDGFEDEDGCPDGDNDDDGVPDKADKCPFVKEDEDGFQDEDGCPDPDNDGDGILDKDDACPNEAGPPNADKKKNGCPIKDPDGDGVAGDKDQCPTIPEDKDGFQDEDGCPDPDNDGDGIPDAEDACPLLKGIPSENPRENGCPDPDPDKDTYVGQDDKCPDKAETWNGFEDDDGCPDEAPKGKDKPEATVKETPSKGGKAPEAKLVIGQPIKFTSSNEPDPASLLVLRAIAGQLALHADWSVAVGVRPSPSGGASEAEARANAVAAAIRRFARREKAAMIVGWDTVKAASRAAELGVGIVLVTPSQAVAEEKVAAPAPATPKPATPKPAAPIVPKPTVPKPAAPIVPKPTVPKPKKP
jgi:OmpA-OmpF porin, OOP family